MQLKKLADTREGVTDGHDGQQLPPHSIEAEQAVLAALLVNPDASLPYVENVLVSLDFYRLAHQKIFTAIKNLAQTGRPVDMVAVTWELKRNRQTATEDGTPFALYVTDLATSYWSAANVEYFADVILEHSRKRATLKLLDRVREEAYDPEKSAAEILANIERTVDRISRRGADGDITDGVALAGDAMTRALIRSENPGIPGIATGFPHLDDLIGGFVNQELIVIAGRPGMGKTAISLGLFDSICSAGVPAAFFSLEMSKQQLMNRLLSRRGRISGRRLRFGDLFPEEWDRLAKAVTLDGMAPFDIIDSDADTVVKMEAHIKALQRKGRAPSVVFVDHLSYLQPRNRVENRTVAVDEITRDLSGLAKRLDIPVILLCQLSRAVETRQDKRPGLSDLRESGGIEQNANVVMFLYRDEYYNKESIHSGEAELIIAKNREGELKTVHLQYNASLNTFMPQPDGWTPAVDPAPAKPPRHPKFKKHTFEPREKDD